MMGREKFVFFDIDGTIYDYDKGIPQSTMEAIRKLRENGHHPVICTGRTRVMIFEGIINMGFDGIIAGGGTYVNWQGQQLFYHELPLEESIRLVEIFRRNGFAAYPEGAEDLYYDPDYIKDGAGSILSIYQRNIPEHVKPVNFYNMKVSKVSALYTNDSNPKGVIDEIGDGYSWADHDGVLFELIPKGFTKADGILTLQKHLGFDMDDTFAFGDSYNDYAMLKLVKYGILMGNASKELKSMIDIHTGTMFEDGVSRALEKFELI